MEEYNLGRGFKSEGVQSRKSTQVCEGVVSRKRILVYDGEVSR